MAGAGALAQALRVADIGQRPGLLRRYGVGDCRLLLDVWYTDQGPLVNTVATRTIAPQSADEGHVPISYSVVQASRVWTVERERRRQKQFDANPAHVIKLRAGIAEFRNLLEARHT